MHNMWGMLWDSELTLYIEDLCLEKISDKWIGEKRFVFIELHKKIGYIRSRKVFCKSVISLILKLSLLIAFDKDISSLFLGNIEC